jgi:uncharacterized membrane protein YphA (DoxX/SURF4 family)
MQNKTTKIIYWVITILISLFFVFDGIGGIMRVQAGKDAIQQLGYPVYLLTIIGVSKILGVIGILQPKYPTLREWAYAGFVINVIGASLSWAFARGPAFNIVFPLIFLVLILVSYFLRKKIGPVPKMV